MTKRKLEIESWAGAATKISGYVGMILELMKRKDYNPTTLVGVSSGSIASLLRISLMIKPSLVTRISKLGTEFTLDHIFNESPLNDKGGIRSKAIFRLIKGETSLGEHYNLEDTIKSIYTKDMHSDYIMYNEYPDFYICSTDLNTGDFIMRNAKSMPYDELIFNIMSSTAIPAVMEPQQDGFKLLADGGVRYSSAGFYLAYKEIEKGNEVISLNSFYSRPKDISSEIREPVSLEKTKFGKGCMKVVGRSAEIMLFQNSKFCEFSEEMMSKIHNFELNQYFLPKILDNSLDVDPDQLNELFQAGRDSIINYKK